jgi:hypothetical protein
MNWSARGNVLNQYLRNTSIGTTVSIRQMFHFRDLSRLPLIQQMSRDRPRKAHVVTETWVSECIEAGTILKERNYGP